MIPMDILLPPPISLLNLCFFFETKISFEDPICVYMYVPHSKEGLFSQSQYSLWICVYLCVAVLRGERFVAHTLKRDCSEMRAIDLYVWSYKFQINKWGYSVAGYAMMVRIQYTQ